MKALRLLTTLCALTLVPGVAVGGPVRATTPKPPLLVAVTASHQGGEDRIVFRFRGGLPTLHRAHYVRRLVADGSGRVIPVAGRAVLRVDLASALAHNASGSTAPVRTAYPLPNALMTVSAGDFEGFVSYGVGLAQRTPVHVTTLLHPARVVVHIGAAFPTVLRRVWLFDRQAFLAGTPPFFVPRARPVLAGTPATALMDRLFAGATRAERSHGLRTLRSGATGVAISSISGGVARVRLTGGCSGSTSTIAGEIMPTLRQLSTVDWVKIFGPDGHTEHPRGARDSIPSCLEP